MKTAKGPSGGWHRDAIYDGQCDWCGWPFGEDDNGGEKGWFHADHDEIACSSRCRRSLDERRAGWGRMVDMAAQAKETA
jgi:hypothetical protein